MFFLIFFFYCYGDLRDLHSFPTRRSSDLSILATVGFFILALATAPSAVHAQATTGTISGAVTDESKAVLPGVDRKSTRLNSSHGSISYAVFCLKKKKNNK